jgi:hypothetical protein
MAAMTPFGELNPQAPRELGLFSFLVGKWSGAGKTRLPDGQFAQYEVTWIGRYILDGMAIADEFHGPFPDGSPFLGISFRQFDARRGAWIIEYLNVSNSFLRRQVNPMSGSVRRDDGAIVVLSEDGENRIREHYRSPDRNHFTYTTDSSPDGGKTWDPVLIEIKMARAD